MFSNFRLSGHHRLDAWRPNLFQLADGIFKPSSYPVQETNGSYMNLRHQQWVHLGLASALRLALGARAFFLFYWMAWSSQAEYFFFNFRNFWVGTWTQNLVRNLAPKLGPKPGPKTWSETWTQNLVRNLDPKLGPKPGPQIWYQT